MRLGIGFTLPHSTPEEWASAHAALGLRAVCAPFGPDTDPATVDAYCAAAAAHDLAIAEVGIWRNAMDPDPARREANIRYSIDCLRLAERVGARCCVNITGAAGPVWDWGYAENLSPAFRRRVVATIREIVDEVKPVRTKFTLEPMPWMAPDSPDDYLRLLDEVDRPGIAVHLDPFNMVNCPARYFDTAALVDECFSKLGPRIRSCHLKNIVIDAGCQFAIREVPLDKGAFDLRHYADAINAADPDLPLILEHQRDEAAYRASLAWLRDTLKLP